MPKDAEPTSRSVAGRAYYACYLAVREKLRTVRGRSYDPNHNDLVRAVLDKTQTAEVVSVIGSGLGTLKDLREKADYHPELVVTRGEAENALEIAQEILGKLHVVTLK